MQDCGYFAVAAFFAVDFLFSAQRPFMASEMRLRPSGLSLRLCSVAAFAFLLPLGRPGPLPAFAAIPESSSRACCSFEISASISAIIRVTSTCCLLGGTENCLLGRILPVPEFPYSNRLRPLIQPLSHSCFPWGARDPYLPSRRFRKV